MTSPTREQVALAVLALLAPLGTPGSGPNAGTFKVVARGVRTAPETGKDNQPALYLFKPPGPAERWAASTRSPSNRTWELGIIIYCMASKAKNPDGSAVVPWESIADPLIELVEGIFEAADSPDDQQLTLGGLVWDCRIDGEGLIGNGDVDPTGQGMVFIPLKIIVP